jgi:hypothetical protein
MELGRLVCIPPEMKTLNAPSPLLAVTQPPGGERVESHDERVAQAPQNIIRRR